jgi:hypothetical protein
LVQALVNVSESVTLPGLVTVSVIGNAYFRLLSTRILYVSVYVPFATVTV